MFGASIYTYRIQVFYSNGNPSAWSVPQSSAIDGGPGPAPMLSTSGTTITASWPASEGAGPLLMNQDGVADNTLLGDGEILPEVQGYLNQAGDTYTGVVGNMLPGTQYDFSLWTPVYEGNGQVLETFGDASITVGGTAQGTPPAAPAFARALYDRSKLGEVDISWANTSNNETEFDVYRVYSTGMKRLGFTSADQTTFVDRPLDNGPYTYYIYAKNSAGLSTGYATATCSAIGGPDISLRLLSIAADLRKQVTAAHYAGTWYSRMVLAFYNTPWANWDISPLFMDSESFVDNSGKLPNGWATVTVAGQVFHDYEANYWLFGVWANAIGIPLDVAISESLLWKSIYIPTADGPDYGNTKDWIENGYYGVFSNTIGDGIPGVSPAAAPPKDLEGNAMSWYVRNPAGGAGSFSGID